MKTMFSCLSIIFSRNFRIFCVSTNVRKFKSYEDRWTDIRGNTRIMCEFLFSHSRKSGLSAEVCAVREQGHYVTVKGINVPEHVVSLTTSIMRKL